MVKWSLQDSAAGGPGFNRSVFEQHTKLPMELVNAQEAVALFLTWPRKCCLGLQAFTQQNQQVGL